MNQPTQRTVYRVVTESAEYGLLSSPPLLERAGATRLLNARRCNYPDRKSRLQIRTATETHWADLPEPEVDRG